MAQILPVEHQHTIIFRYPKTFCDAYVIPDCCSAHCWLVALFDLLVEREFRGGARNVPTGC